MEAAHIAALQRMPIFGGLRADVLEMLLAGSMTVSKPKGGYFFRENDAAESLFVIETGRVAILKPWYAEEHLLSELGPGDCFGEMALMDFFPRSASVKAVEPTDALEIPIAAIHSLYEKNLEQFAMIQMNLGREVSRRLRQADDRLFRLRMGSPDANEPIGPLT
jgi:CRP-like cAMP-binding protein